MRTPTFLATLLLGALAVSGCSGDGAEQPAISVPDGGGRPSDGARGVCCRVTANPAHSYRGGYTEDPASCGELWDNICNPRIVTGDHGCGKFAYDVCSASKPGGGDLDASVDAAIT